MTAQNLKKPYRSTPKINTNKKSYSIQDSILYNITTKRKLSEVLSKPTKDLSKLTKDDNYRVFELVQKNKKAREIQAPMFALDIVHSRIASLLTRIKIPDYVHSGVKGRSNITNAKVHIGYHPVLTMDIQQFYPSVSKKSIFHFFKNTLNASPDVAGLLAELCTYSDHIPTGSRLSMPLAYWANHTLYNQLKILCDSHKVTMSVYVDDLTFSGTAVNESFKKLAKQTISNAGLTVHPRKTRFYKANEPKKITGVIIDGDELKVQNEHHKKIYAIFLEMAQVSNDKDLETLQRSLIGRLQAAGQIDPKFKSRAKSLVTAVRNKPKKRARPQKQS